MATIHASIRRPGCEFIQGQIESGNRHGLTRVREMANRYQRVVIRNMTNSRVYLKRVAGASAPGTGDLQMRER